MEPDGESSMRPPPVGRGHRADDGSLVVHYQPIVRLGDGRPVAVEALVRWRHPVRGVLLPATFLPGLGRRGLLGALGRFVLAESLRDLTNLRRLLDLTDLTVSVNVAPAQLLDDRVVDEVRAAIGTSGAAPGDLVLEVSEQTNFDRSDVIARVEALRALGVRIGLDDFGTGRAALGVLDLVGIDQIKIDRSIAGRASSSRIDRAIVEAVTTLSRQLDVDVVAEGVQTADDRSALMDLGVRLAQGHLFQRAVPAHQLSRLTWDPPPGTTHVPADRAADESERLELLDELDLVRGDEPWLGEMTALASDVCRTPMACVSFLDADRQWNLAPVGLDLPSLPREASMCAHTMLHGRALVVEDTTGDRRLAANPFVVGGPGIRFYAGAPVVVEGHALGAVCVLDTVPRQLSGQQVRVLELIASRVSAALTVRLMATREAQRGSAARGAPPEVAR